jgi:hypothetical protein
LALKVRHSLCYGDVISLLATPSSLHSVGLLACRLNLVGTSHLDEND